MSLFRSQLVRGCGPLRQSFVGRLLSTLPETEIPPETALLPFEFKGMNATLESVDWIPEARLSLTQATTLLKSLCVGYPDLQVRLRLRCKTSDSSMSVVIKKAILLQSKSYSRDLRGTSILPVNFMRLKTLVFAKVLLYIVSFAFNLLGPSCRGSFSCWSGDCRRRRLGGEGISSTFIDNWTSVDSK